ncbi:MULTISPECIES: hypothetical protein [unclassified Rathayibacter]|uniref:hypothetical protein n=1 Tax=unclassified Rathayibacter TaxID=2609250 RepID=UPI000AA7C15B|nr:MULTISPECIES: hypothetical protein [unclassified Rathayibacter]
MSPAASIPPARGLLRVAVGVCAIAMIGYAFGLSVAAGDANPFDYFGYFTNQTSLFVSVLLVASGGLSLAQRRAPS